MFISLVTPLRVRIQTETSNHFSMQFEWYSLSVCVLHTDQTADEQQHHQQQQHVNMPQHRHSIMLRIQQYYLRASVYQKWIAIPI